MSKYLLEIGTEELPYKFIPQAIEQLKKSFEDFLKNNKIEFNSVKVYATPRRLAVTARGLAEKQPDTEKILKGPDKNAAYDKDGNLTQAGKGFLQKNQLDEKDAYLENDYLHARVFLKGKLTSELIKENASRIILSLQGPHFMRWGTGDDKFSRPIRWVVSILDNKELPIQIAGVQSSKFTRGHRFSPNANTEINNVDEYNERLKQSEVIVNQEERKQLIAELIKKEAAKLNAQPYYDESLLDEVTYLCEYPASVVCDFDVKYLEIPEKVTVTVMARHQRYFALYKNGKLLNKFITVTNYTGNDFSNIKAGNERVIAARLDDAVFFFKEDIKKPFESYVEALKGVTFQKNMGSMYDKTQRIIKLSEFICEQTACTDKQSVTDTAFLCKADLTTSLVFEFTELQGFIGADYAKISGKDEKIIQGIKEHYFPLNAESELAEGIEGQITGIADKTDTICAVFAGGKIPSGSSDPLGIRRAALGIIKTIINKKLNINLSELIKKALEFLPVKSGTYSKADIYPNVNIYPQIEEFLIQRLIIFLSDEYRKDILEACSTNKNPLEDLCDFVRRVEIITELINKPEFLPVLESANRINRILKENIIADIDKNLFFLDAEKELFEGINKINENSYETLCESFILINPLIEKFFEDVLVMDKNEKIKQNRLAMLTYLKKKYELIANFNALQM